MRASSNIIPSYLRSSFLRCLFSHEDLCQPFDSEVFLTSHYRTGIEIVSGTNRKAMRPALVLTWDATTTRVRCPYKCRSEIHSHGTTMPREGFMNARAAHCGPDEFRHARQYRLVCTFENDEISHEMFRWWELDRKHRRWRTIG
jgi:hypothetical protein